MRRDTHIITRQFDLDPSCKLWLPFYKYGAEQSKIWDQSGNNNHGTITGAVPYPGNPQRTSVGSTYNRGDFTATNAFFWSSLDLSPYAGTDLGSTPFRIVALDGAGKKATGYLGAVGAGETLGSEVMADPGFDNPPSWSAEAGWSIAGSLGVAAATNGYCNQTISPTVKALYKVEIALISRTAGSLDWAWYDQTPILQKTIPDVYTGYVNSELSLCGSGLKGNGLTGTIDNATAKRVTDPPATAVHIVSSLNGTTRNWASVESGFNPNTIASWKINKVVPNACIGWYFDDVDDRIVHPSINFGKTHTLLYWIHPFANAKDIIHGGAANYHVAIDGTNLHYNAGATELSQAHGGGMTQSTMIGIVRSGTTVQFFKNGTQVGNNQTLDANNDLTLTTIGSYDTPGTFFGGVVSEGRGFNRGLSPIENRNYYELSRHI